MNKLLLLLFLFLGCESLKQNNKNKLLKHCNEYHVRYLNECYEKCINGGESEDWCDKECQEVVTNKLCK